MDIKELTGVIWEFYGAVNNQFRIGREGSLRTFEVVEDESDGYRSSMEELREVEASEEIFPKTPITQIEVVDDSGETQDLCSLKDIWDGHVWLSFGTDNNDDYYPCFVFSYTPLVV